MWWLSWRQIRTPAVLVLGGCAVMAIALLLTGARVEDTFDSSGVATCLAGDESGQENCGDVERGFLRQYPLLRSIGDLINLLPALIGAFWGAPLLAREFETGTHRLAWTQGVTRHRWLAVKLALVGGLAAAVTAVLSLLFTWWSEPFDRVQSRITPVTFAERGVAPVAYVAFAFVLGVVIGTVVRRTLPAMALVLAGTAAIRVGVQSWIRPRLIEPAEVSYPTFQFAAPDTAELAAVENGWLLSGDAVDETGHVLGPAGQSNGRLDSVALERCGIDVVPDGELKNVLDACGEELGLQDVVKFHPAEHFWALQAWESAVFVLLTISLVAFCFWWIRRSA